MDDSRSAIGRFRPMQAGDPSIGKPCIICTEQFVEGDVPTLISLAPRRCGRSRLVRGHDAEEAAKQAAGRPFNAVAGIAHEGCAWPSEKHEDL